MLLPNRHFYRLLPASQMNRGGGEIAVSERTCNTADDHRGYRAEEFCRDEGVVMMGVQTGVLA